MTQEALEVEAAGETVGEAKWSALRELERMHPGLDKTAVRFEVVSEGERGLLGVGYSPARVVASIPASSVAAPLAEEGSPLATEVRELVERILAGLGTDCRVELVETDDTIVASCVGRDLGVLIGRHGQTIDAIQYLVNAIVARNEFGQRKHVVVDAAGYRARREAALEALAVSSAERAVASGRPVELEPMSSVERRIVHARLQDFAGVETRSEGTEPTRHVVVVPSGN